MSTAGRGLLRVRFGRANENPISLDGIEKPWLISLGLAPVPNSLCRAPGKRTIRESEVHNRKLRIKSRIPATGRL